MSEMRKTGWRGAVLLVPLLLSAAGLAAGLAGCVGAPDAGKMAAIRGESAQRRLADLARKETTDSAVYLAGPLLLSESVALALGYNRRLEQERYGREIARGRIEEAYGEVLPSLRLSGGVTRRDRELGTGAGEEWRVTRFQDAYAAEARLSQPLWNGRIGSAWRSARLYDELTKVRLRTEADRVVLEVIQAYYGAVLKGHLLQVNVSAMETAEAQLSDARARRQQGMASNYDELRAEVEVSNFHAQVLKARNERDVAYTELCRLIGASPESAVELVDEIPLVEETVEFHAALAVGLTRRADVIQAEYAVRMQRESVAVVRSRYFPEVSGYVSQTWANPDPHQSSRDEWGDEWQAGVQVAWPLFDGFARKGLMRQEMAKLKQQEIALLAAEEQAVSEVRQGVLTLATAAEFARSQNRNLDTAREAVRLVQAGLKEGQNTPVEVMDARQALTLASANYYESLFAHVMARVLLHQAMGVLLESDAGMGVGAAVPVD